MEKKILVIDDNVDFSDAVRMILETGPYAVDVANSTEEAEAKLEKEVPDLIILDILMQKGAEGIVMSRKLKKDPRFANVPVMMLTSMTKQTGFRFVEEDPRNEKFLPVDMFVEKPVAPKDLLEKVKQILAAKGKG